MEKITTKLGIFGLFGLLLASVFTVQAFAITPTITLTATGSNTVQVSVYGDANSAVTLYYYNYGGLSYNTGTIGYTNSSGYFSSTLNGTSYILSAGSQVYVMVNGQQSNSIAWPTTSYNGGGWGGGGSLSLSQNNVSLSVGQTQTVYVNSSYYGGNYYNAGYYVSGSSIGVVTSSVSGNAITLYGQSQGSVSLQVCDISYSGACTTLYVAVSGPVVQPPVVNQSNVQLTVGQNQTVRLYASNPYTYGYGYNTFYISNNSNPSAVNASVNGASLYVYGLSAGNATITVCEQYSGQCSTSYVTVTGSYYTPAPTPHYPPQTSCWSYYRGRCLRH